MHCCKRNFNTRATDEEHQKNTYICTYHSLGFNGTLCSSPFAPTRHPLIFDNTELHSLGVLEVPFLYRNFREESSQLHPRTFGPEHPKMWCCISQTGHFWLRRRRLVSSWGENGCPGWLWSTNGLNSFTISWPRILSRSAIVTNALDQKHVSWYIIIIGTIKTYPSFAKARTVASPMQFAPINHVSRGFGVFEQMNPYLQW